MADRTTDPFTANETEATASPLRQKRKWSYIIATFGMLQAARFGQESPAWLVLLALVLISGAFLPFMRLFRSLTRRLRRAAQRLTGEAS